MKKKILWISRHPLWDGQRKLLVSLHGKKCDIEERNFRFEDEEHFLDFLEHNQKEYFIYVVVSEKWKQGAIEEGYSLGTIHKPQRKKEHGKKSFLFRIEFISVLSSKQKTSKKVLPTKGVVRKPFRKKR